jgi:flagellar biosynthesis/type III secretory pathway protein FliH
MRVIPMTRLKSRAYREGFEDGYAAAMRDAAAKLQALEPERQALRDSIEKAQALLASLERGR